ncbi:MAG: hypothetical protein QW594_04450 [Candidatus Woesearchaeota archaeon]
MCVYKPIHCSTNKDCNDYNPYTRDLCKNKRCVFEPLECLTDDDCDDYDPTTINRCINHHCSFFPSNTTNTSKSVELRWIDANPEKDGFELYKKTNDGPYVFYQHLGPSSFFFIDKLVEPGNIYQYKLRTVKGNDKSPFSNTASVNYSSFLTNKSYTKVVGLSPATIPADSFAAHTKTFKTITNMNELSKLKQHAAPPKNQASFNPGLEKTKDSLDLPLFLKDTDRRGNAFAFNDKKLSVFSGSNDFYGFEPEKNFAKNIPSDAQYDGYIVVFDEKKVSSPELFSKALASVDNALEHASLSEAVESTTTKSIKAILLSEDALYSPQELEKIAALPMVKSVWPNYVVSVQLA